MRQLNVDLDSLKHVPDSLYKRNLAELSSYVRYSRYKDSVVSKKEITSFDEKIPEQKIDSFDVLIPDSLQSSVF